MSITQDLERIGQKRKFCDEGEICESECCEHKKNKKHKTEKNQKVKGLPVEILRITLSYLDACDFQLASVCKSWRETFYSKGFLCLFCKNRWNVDIDESRSCQKIREYIFERFQLENLPLRMKAVIDNYCKSHDKKYLSLLQSMINQEQFTTDTKGRVLKWLDDMNDRFDDKIILTTLLKKQLCYEDYDKFIAQDGDALFGEGWNGSLRIFDHKGYFVTITFNCYCHPGHHREKIALSFKMCNDQNSHKIIVADDNYNENAYIFDSKKLAELKQSMGLYQITHTNLFCFLLFSMGSLLDYYRFQTLSTSRFNIFWNELESLDKEIS